MKNIYLVLTIVLVNTCSTAHAQQITYSGKNIPLKTVFATIQKQTGYGFFYDPTLLTQAKAVTLNFQNAPLAEVLMAVFKNQLLEYSIENKTILVLKKKTPVNAKIIAKQKSTVAKAITIDSVAASSKQENQKKALSGTMPEKNADLSLKVLSDTSIIKPATTQGPLTSPGSKDAINLPVNIPELVKPQSGQIVSNGNKSSSKALFNDSFSPMQFQKITFGFKGGINISRIHATDIDGSRSGYAGAELYGGFFADTRMSTKLNLGTELIFSYTDSYHFIELPVHLKYNIKEKWNLMAGLKLDYIADGMSDFNYDNFKRVGISGEIGSQYQINQLFFAEVRYAHGFTPQINSQGFGFYNGYRNTFRLGLGINFNKNEPIGKVSKELGPLRLRVGLNAGAALTSGYDIVGGGDLRIQTNISSTTAGMLTAGYNHYSLKFGFDETNIAYFPIKAGLKFFPASPFYIAPEAGIAIGSKSEAFTYPFLYAAGIGTETKNGFDISIRYEKMTGHIVDYLDEIKRPAQLALRVEYSFNLNSGKSKSGEFSTAKTEPEVTGKRRKYVFAEFLGNGGIISGNFDTRLKPDRNDGFGLRAGVGISGNYLTIPLGLNYIVGKRRSGFETGIGITTAVRIINDQNLNRNPNASGLGAAGFLSVGYRLQSYNGFMFRSNVSIFLEPGNIWAPWPGLSIGYLLNKRK